MYYLVIHIQFFACLSRPDDCVLLPYIKMAANQSRFSCIHFVTFDKLLGLNDLVFLANRSCVSKLRLNLLPCSEFRLCSSKFCLLNLRTRTKESP